MSKNPALDILQAFGISSKNVVSFTIDCAGHDKLPTITTQHIILGEQKFRYEFVTREVTEARPIAPPDPPAFDLDVAVQQATQRVTEQAFDIAALNVKNRALQDKLTALEFLTTESKTMSNDQTIEREIQAKGLTAPRVTPEDIEANIDSEHYFTATQALFGTTRGPEWQASSSALDLLTFCVLVLRNGFTVTGESACASPENFDAALGRKIARANAVQKMWPLMGYALKERLLKQ